MPAWKFGSNVTMVCIMCKINRDCFSHWNFWVQSSKQILIQMKHSQKIIKMPMLIYIFWEEKFFCCQHATWSTCKHLYHNTLLLQAFLHKPPYMHKHTYTQLFDTTAWVENIQVLSINFTQYWGIYHYLNPIPNIKTLQQQHLTTTYSSNTYSNNT